MSTQRNRVVLHVGAPKTGTTYLQHVLFSNRARLRHQHVLYPGRRFDGHFLAALDLMQLTWGGLEREAVGAWDGLAGEVAAHHGTAVVSHEILATASRAQVARALESFGDAEVHVVFSARNLVRQIPAEYQETVKHRRTVGYASFLRRIQAPERTGRLATWFWGVQDLPDVLDRWGHALPASQVHVLTVPPPGSPPDLLWQRFRDLVGIDDRRLEMQGGLANPSLGVPETALVRRVNQRVNDVVENHHYREFVRELLAHNTLAGHRDSPRLQLPPDVRSWAAALFDSWCETVQERGYDVIGDLAEVRHTEDAEDVEFTDPDRPDEAAVGAAALDAVAALVEQAARMRQEADGMQREIDGLRHALGRSYLRPSYQLREKVVRAAGRSPAGRAALGVYRKARGRS